MLLQTNSYIVPKEKRNEHARLLQRFRHTLAKLGCDQFECYEQTGANWSAGESSNRFVQIMRFRDRKHQLSVQAAERTDPAAQTLIKEFCELINFPYQQQQGYFAVGFYNSVLPVAALRVPASNEAVAPPPLPGATPEPEPMPFEETAIDEALSDEMPAIGMPAEESPADESPAEESPESTLEVDQAVSTDPFQPAPENDVATADFGDILDLDSLIMDDEESTPAEPKSASDEKLN